MANNDIIKEAVAEGMRELMRHKTIDHISVTEICEECNLNRRTFYRYFQDKYEVVDWIYYHDNLTNSFRYGGWSFWDYWPHIAKTMYEDPSFYRNAFNTMARTRFATSVSSTSDS